MTAKPHPGRRRAKKHDEEEHENHERWLVSYADMVTLLMCLFIVLFAISQVDKAKFAALSQGLSASFGAPITALPGSTPEADVLDGLPAAVDIAAGIAPQQEVGRSELEDAAAQAASARERAVAAEAEHTYEDLSEARDRIDSALTRAGFPDAARYEIDERGLVVHIVADAVLFDAEEATLRSEGRRILSAVAPTLTSLPNELRVEGHANHLPVTSGGPWPSNWELSAYRATTVLRALTGAGVPEKRISAAGYADTRPLLPISDAAALTTNRRVDVVVLSTASAEANALLPGLDESRVLEGTEK
jgi:chemotaxis protein MotB